MARSVELVAQRRRVELHLKAQSKAVKAQAVRRGGCGPPPSATRARSVVTSFFCYLAAEGCAVGRKDDTVTDFPTELPDIKPGRQALFDEGLRALEAEVRKGVARLRATEGFLVTCLSSKAIGIRQREAEALRQKLEKVGCLEGRRRGHGDRREVGPGGR